MQKEKGQRDNQPNNLCLPRLVWMVWLGGFPSTPGGQGNELRGDRGDCGHLGEPGGVGRRQGMMYGPRTTWIDPSCDRFFFFFPDTKYPKDSARVVGGRKAKTASGDLGIQFSIGKPLVVIRCRLDLCPPAT